MEGALELEAQHWPPLDVNYVIVLLSLEERYEYLFCELSLLRVAHLLEKQSFAVLYCHIHCRLHFAV